MAGPRICRNPPPTGEDELAGDASGAPTEGSNTPTPFPTISRSQTPAPTQAPAPAPGLPDMYTNVDLQRATRLALELFVKGQEHGKANSAPRDKALKARNPDLYYGSSHMECYYFCQQCEDHFDTAGDTGHQRVSFAASFLRDRINFRWQQHKTQVERDRVAPPTWDEFKAFLRQSLGESTAFVTSIWTKIKRDSQHQQEEIQDWASHLQHLKSILVEFDPRCALTEEILCRYFYKGLRPSIRLWIDKKGQDRDGWNDLIKKAIRAEAKAKIQASASRDLDQQCHQGNRPIHTSAAKAQAAKDPRPEEPKAQDPELTTPPRSNNSEFPAKSRREKKEQYRQDQARSRNSRIPATNTNAIDADKVRKDLSHITYFNCNETGHYADKCTKPKADATDK